jgi:hypothetical protein
MIYLLKTEGLPYYKLGFTESNLEERILNLQCGNPHTIKSVATFEGGFLEESLIHAALRDNVALGEWYVMQQAPLRTIRYLLWRDGESMPQINEILEPLPDHKGCYRMPPEINWEIEILRSRGLKYREIVDALGVSEVCIKNNLTPGYRNNMIRFKKRKSQQ